MSAWTMEDPGESTLGMGEGIMIYDNDAPPGKKLVAEVIVPEHAPVIAASREAVEVLERMADRFEATLGAVHTTRTDRRILKAARDVIAKARGDA